MAVATIRPTDNDHYVVEGELCFDTIPSLRQKGDAFIQSSHALNFDFSGVTRSDSSAMALLLAWYRTAHKLQKKLTYINLSSQMRDLIHLSNLDHFFNKETI